jgi:NAD(P)-dependent dehydrogenase (short-subunit alcohol dehydrogenase family)
MDISGKRFLVIGGSGVLGGELVRQLHGHGAAAMATASSNDSAAKIPAVAEVRLLLDYTSPESITTLTDYLSAATELDGVINAAGVVAFGGTETLDAELVEKLFRINALGPIQLLSSLAPVLAKQPQSVVVNLTGVVAEAPLPNLAAYSASKTAIAGFLAGAAREWRRAGTRVISANPGHTETGLAGRAIAGVAPNFPQGMTPEHVASRIIDAIVNDEKELASSAF